MKKTCGKRLLSLLLALVMVLGLMPTSVFAADAVDPKETQTTTSKDVPPTDAPCEGYEWVLADEIGTQVLKCTDPENHEDDHQHTDSCYAKNCGHDFGHTDACYEGGNPGKWVICDHKEGTDGYCKCYKTLLGYNIHYGMDVETFCTAMGVPSYIAKKLADLVGKAGIPTCTDCANKLGLKILELRFGDEIPEAYSWLPSVLDLLEDARVIDYAHYVPGEGATLKCDHVCSNACLELVCDKAHTDACYVTEYTWKQELKTLTVTFDSNGGTAVESASVKYGKTVSEPAEPTKSGFIFDGWYNGTAKWDFANPVKASVTLTARWKPDTPTTDKVVEVLNGYKVTVVCVNGVMKDEHRAKDYGVLADCIEVDAKGVTTNADGNYEVKVTLSAAGYANEFSKTTGTVHTAKSTSPDKTITLVYSDGNWTYTGETSTTFETLCQTTTYTVTFDSNGGSAVTPNTVTVNKGDKVNKPAAPNRTGYEFLGWYNDTAEWVFDENTVTDNLKLTAKWQLAQPSTENVETVLGSVQFKVECDNDYYNKTTHLYWECNYIKGTVTKVDEVNTTDNTVVVTIATGEYAKAYSAYLNNKTHTATDATKTLTLTFTDGAWTVPAQTVVDIHTNCTTTYTVTFYSDGKEVKKQDVEKGKTATEPTDVTKDDFTLVGWYDGETKWDFTKTVTKDMDLTAKWAPDSNNNGVDDADETITVNIVGSGAVNGEKKTFSFVYDSTDATAKSIAIKAVPASDTYVATITVDAGADVIDSAKFTDKDTRSYTHTFTATGSHTVTVTFAQPDWTAKDPIGTVPMDMNKTVAEQKSDLEAAIFNAVVATTTPAGVTVADVTVTYKSTRILSKDVWRAIDFEAPSKLWEDGYGFAEFPTEDGKTAEVKVSYPGDTRYPAAELTGTITLTDARLATEVTGNDASVTYGYSLDDLFEAIKPVVSTEDGAVNWTEDEIEFVIVSELISGTGIKTEESALGLSVSDTPYTVTVRYKGNNNYRGCECTIQLTVTKAPVKITVESQTGKYGVTEFKNPISTNPEGVKHIDFVVGLDAHDETDLTYTAQVVLPIEMPNLDNVPEPFKSMLKTIFDELEDSMTGTIDLGGLADILGKLAEITENETISKYLGGLGIDMDTVNTIIKVLTAVTGYFPEAANLEIQVTTKLDLPENVGAYLIGSVTADANYKTDLGVGYLIITPNGVRVDLDWVEKDTNGILTLPKYNSFDLSAKAAMDPATLEGADQSQLDGTPESHIRYLFLGVDKDLNLILSEELGKDAKAGAYVEVAYLTNWDNVMYYAAPIARTLVLVPSIAEVTFVDDKGEANNDRLFTYDGKQHSMPVQVKVNGEVVTPAAGELTVTYVGIDGHAEGYNSTVAPTEAGAYAVYAVYVQRTNGEVTAAGCAVGAMVIQKATPIFSLSDNDTVKCGDGESFAIVNNPNGLDYFSVAIGGGKVYVNLPADWDEHVSKLPAEVQTKINALVKNADGMSNEQFLAALNEVIAALNSVNKADEAAKVLESILAKIESTSSSAIQSQIVKQLEALKKELGNKIPDEVVDLMKKLFGAVSSADAAAIKTRLLSEIDKLDLPAEVKAELKAMVEGLADKVSSNEQLNAAITELQNLLKNYQLPNSSEIASAITGVITGAIDKAELTKLLEDAIAKLNTCAQVKVELEALRSELDDYKFTVVMGHNPATCGEYDCYAVNVSANYVSVLAKAKLTVKPNYVVAETVAPTCTDVGYTRYSCACKVNGGDCDCDCTDTLWDYVAALGHDWGKWTEDTTKGDHYRTCKNGCGEVDRAAHNWGDWDVTDAGCTTDGSKTRTCKDCGATQTETIPANGHKMGKWYQTIAPNYGSKGQERRDCQHCDYYELRDIDALVSPVLPVPVDPTPTVNVKGLDTVNHVAYIVGRDTGLVDPDGTITRAEVATIYFRLMTDEFRNLYWSNSSSYSDVADTAWYNVAVATLEKAGIIKDTRSGGAFRPNEPITRAELAVMAAQFCTVTGNISKSSFSDVPANHWAAAEIALVEYAGWIEGFAGAFRPEDNLSRAECVTIVNRMLNRGAEAENMLSNMVTFADNVSGKWYYEAIQEAANSHTYTRTTKKLTGEIFYGEQWVTLLTAPDWAALEKQWAEANQD